MSKDMAMMDLRNLSDEELARLEARLFCAGGPPEQATQQQMQQVCAQPKQR